MDYLVQVWDVLQVWGEKSCIISYTTQIICLPPEMGIFLFPVTWTKPTHQQDFQISELRRIQHSGYLGLGGYVACFSSFYDTLPYTFPLLHCPAYFPEPKNKLWSSRSVLLSEQIVWYDFRKYMYNNTALPRNTFTYYYYQHHYYHYFFFSYKLTFPALARQCKEQLINMIIISIAIIIINIIIIIIIIEGMNLKTVRSLAN